MFVSKEFAESILEDPIAVVGIGCYFPGAESPSKLWENILTRRREFRRFPDERLPLGEYYNADKQALDKTYGQRAAVIHDFVFDWAMRRFPRQAYQCTDIAHWLALEVAISALENAGYTRENVPHNRTGVIVGNTLTGEHTRSNAMRLRWPFMKKVLESAAISSEIPDTQMHALIETAERRFKSVFPPTTEDTLAGGLSNTIAGRICGYFNLHGGGYTIDGACSSSLLAICNAAERLSLGELDVVLAGGVDISLDAFEIIGFAKTSALSAGDMYVYDEKAAGFLPGEGSGFVVMKRLSDAREAGDRVLAIVRGWGISSDGKGAITQPNANGQATAIERAYAKAGYSAASLDFVEGHGTGTPVGDKIELEGIAKVVGNVTPRSCGVTSFKSISGHTKAAAGVGAFIKAVIAANRRVMPPTAGCDQPNEIFNNKSRSLYPIRFGQVCDPSKILRVGVSAMGFGGINSHVTLVSGDAPASELAPALEERRLLASYQNTELFVFGATSIGKLIEEMKPYAETVDRLSMGEMPDLAGHLTDNLSKGLVRAAIVAGSPDQLALELNELIQHLETVPPATGEVTAFKAGRVVVGNDIRRHRLGFLFPGQGSQQLAMARPLVERFDWARDLVAKADEWVEEVGCHPISPLIYRPLDRAADKEEIDEWVHALSQTEVAQPAICLASVLYSTYMAKLGLKPSVVGGHSLGELTAFQQAGAFDVETLIKLAAIRGCAMMASPGKPGAMAYLLCNREQAETLCEATDGYVVVANINSPLQVVISGEELAVLRLQEKADQQGIRNDRLRVSNAFHSKLVASAGQRIRDCDFLPQSVNHLTAEILSGINGFQIKAGETDLREYFAGQITAQVDFVSLMEKMKDRADLVIEVGPGKMTTGLMEKSFGNAICLPLASHPERDEDLNTAVGMSFIHGHDIIWQPMYESRLIRQYVPASERLFIENPCERPLNDGNIDDAITAERAAMEARILSEKRAVAPKASEFVASNSKKAGAQKTMDLSIAPAPIAMHPVSAVTGASVTDDAMIESVLLELVHEQTGYPMETIPLSSRLLDDLNLDSIKASEFVMGAATRLGVTDTPDPTRFANASLGEIVQALKEAGIPVPTMSSSIPTPAVLPSVSAEAVVEAQLLELAHKLTGYPIETIPMTSRLLDDLNLDSIKAGEYIVTAVAKLGVTDYLDPSRFANASLAEIARALMEAGVQQSATVAAPAAMAASGSQAASPVQDARQTFQPTELMTKGSDWVRNFTIRYVPRAAVKTNHIDWFCQKVLVVADLTERDLVEALNVELRNHGALVEIAAYGDPSLNGFKHYNHRIAVLPRQGSGQEGDRDYLARLISRLQSVATPPQTMTGESHVTYLQFGAPEHGDGKRATNPETSCAASFARSLHLERNDLHVRVLDFFKGIDAVQMAQLVHRELAATETFSMVSYDGELTRTVPESVVSHPETYTRREVSGEDVVLITGGAKGITAECAVALGKKTGAKLALVGRSLIGDTDNEVAQTLARCKEAGLTIRYYPCDITDAVSVVEMVNRVNNELGKVTVVVHGAGANKPRPIKQVALEDAIWEVSPKLLGAYNLIKALEANPPRLFMALTSIIGVTGMPGNCIYAFSNETLDLMMREFGESHATDVVCLAYSVWDEVGMGARMGSVERLSHMGIGAIPVSEGVARFLQLFEGAASDSQIVITARLAGLDTWNPVDLPSYDVFRFIEHVDYLEPGVELKAHADLDINRDLYVKDHVYNGSYLLPTVFGLEAMAEATAYVLGERNPEIVRIEDISLQRPIVVDPTDGVTIAIFALVHEATNGECKVEVNIRTERSGFAIAHFSATLVVGSLTEGPQQNLNLGDPLAIVAKRDLYGGLLFQGPLFQRMGPIHELREKYALLRSFERPATELSEEGFVTGCGTHVVLGDAFFRDVLLQSIQLTVPRDICLPISIDRIDLHKTAANDDGTRIVDVDLQRKEGNEYIGAITAMDRNGNVVEQLSGYRLRILEEKPKNPTVTELADPQQRDEQILHNEFNDVFERFGLKPVEVTLGYQPGMQFIPLKQRHKLERPTIERALRREMGKLDTDPLKFTLKKEKSGKPNFGGKIGREFDLSLSHDDIYLMCVVGRDAQGCDIEPIISRSREDWMALLGKARGALIEELMASGDTLDSAATRLWSAVEAVRKVDNEADPVFSLEERSHGFMILKTTVSGREHLVVTLDFEFTRRPDRMIAIVVHKARVEETTDSRPQEQAELLERWFPSSMPRELAETLILPNAHHVRITDDGPEGQLVYEQRFQISFKEAASICRNVYYTHFITWIGKIRELPMQNIAADLVDNFVSGEWGMVTNAANVRVYGDATAYDVIEARAYLGNVVNPTFVTYLEFSKVLSNGSKELIAKGEVRATWVRLESYGVPSPRKFPKYLQDYLDIFAPKPEAMTVEALKPKITTGFASMDLGTQLYSRRPGLDKGRILGTETFQTTLEEANLVGNVYYGNYFIWQGRARDMWLYKHIPQLLRASKSNQELVCLYSGMDYLREAMPFDRVQVVFSLEELTTHGAVFNFEFFRVNSDGSKEKLSVGRQETLWVERDEEGKAMPAKWPAEILEAMTGYQATVSQEYEVLAV